MRSPITFSDAAGVIRRLALALLSGCAAYPAGRLGDALQEIFPLPLSNWSTVLVGGLFAVLVMWPRLRGVPGRALRAVGLVLAGIGIYALSVWLAVSGYGPLHLDGTAGVIASGALAAVLVVAAVAGLAPAPVHPRVWPYALAAGVAGGAIFDFALKTEVGPEALAIGTGYAAWQLLVCMALELGLRPGPGADSTGQLEPR